MKIVVIGGTGLIGTKLVRKLRQKGHEVVAASPGTGVNCITGEGLAEALAGAEVVVDVANSPSFEDKAVLDFFEISGRNLLAAEAAAGVKHHVALSVVGTDRMLGSGYFRAKMAQEALIEASGIPYTILRATQFFEFMGGIARSSAGAEQIRLSPALVQPIASEDVAEALADVTLGAPMNGILEVAGPERRPLAELVREYLSANKDHRDVIIDVEAPYFGVRLDDQSLTPGDSARVMPTRFDDWLALSLAGVK
ncbi:SDR family oxidoreductase [Sorangium sp. So ce1389]|uniref:SDR family oxidoreductase n=1 Tax=Sorangium sp. So ce1389 TaxID=3133336 RepID=UPI003F5FD1F0